MSDDLKTLRTAASDAIIKSPATKRLIVAGPGTGKTFTFQQALETAGGKGLAVTFIRNLVVDLEASLGELAEVYSFHGFCKHLMHQHDVAGLNEGDYYPPLFQLLAIDIAVLTGDVVDTRAVELRFHDLDESDGLIGRILERADYYTAVSHTDLVFRVLRHFETAPGSIPAYPLVVVDEIQDFSRLETEFITLLSSKNRILAAGDDDQALYVGLKHAMPGFIRGLANGNEYESFELPYCSRCTQVVVGAVNDVVTAATKSGRLAGRLPKQFSCYLPDKADDSKNHPNIVHARCSTENVPYAGAYIGQQIARIPPTDVETSRKGRYPTVLVVGPNPFLNRAFNVVREHFPHARMKIGAKLEIDLLDGYRRLAGNECSRLGWRIVMAGAPFNGDDALLRDVLSNESELHDALPDTYRAEHLRRARLVHDLLDNVAVSAEDEADLTSCLARSIEEIRIALGREPSPDEEDLPNPDDIDEDQPDIFFTNLVGSKGLSAEHVFVVGMMNGHFPRDPKAVTDEEVCSFLVALSRTRKQCHLVSAGFFGRGTLTRSIFLNWVSNRLTTVVVDKNYDFTP